MSGDKTIRNGMIGGMIGVLLALAWVLTAVFVLHLTNSDWQGANDLIGCLLGGVGVNVGIRW